MRGSYCRDFSGFRRIPAGFRFYYTEGVSAIMEEMLQALLRARQFDRKFNIVGMNGERKTPEEIDVILAERRKTVNLGSRNT